MIGDDGFERCAHDTHTRATVWIELWEALSWVARVDIFHDERENTLPLLLLL